jgi:hypothetical protein
MNADGRERDGAKFNGGNNERGILLFMFLHNVPPQSALSGTDSEVPGLNRQRELSR